MTTSTETEYLRRQLASHARVFFTESASGLLGPDGVVFLPYEAATRATGEIIAIPDDLAVPSRPISAYRIPFNGTELTVWNRIPRPPTDVWAALPNEDTPLWFRNRSGTLIPAWDLFGNLFSLLTFQEERSSKRRDRHGRFIAAYSPRMAANLLEVPAFNEAVAAVVAARASQRRNDTQFDNLAGLVGAPTLVLSHDCDILRGTIPGPSWPGDTELCSLCFMAVCPAYRTSGGLRGTSCRLVATISTIFRG